MLEANLLESPSWFLGYTCQGRSTPYIGDGHPTLSDGNPESFEQIFINPYGIGWMSLFIPNPSESPNTGNNWGVLYSIFHYIYIFPSWKSWVDFGGPFLKRLFRHHGSTTGPVGHFFKWWFRIRGNVSPKSPQKIGVEIIAHRIRGTIVYLPTFGLTFMVNVGKMQVNIAIHSWILWVSPHFAPQMVSLQGKTSSLSKQRSSLSTAPSEVRLVFLVEKNHLVKSARDLTRVFWAPKWWFMWDPLFQGSLGWWYHNLARIMGSQVIGALEIQFRTLPKKESNPLCWRVQWFLGLHIFHVFWCFFFFGGGLSGITHSSHSANG